ncbi:hypothetical protein H4Q26_017686 [Puccinia striiformis f. sp. tritici PST-130]|uniref:Uncharacterized protein n=1 Tax=Puccinia striiformis f. sp. tritici PST-78 TaxID=1165861 RepID=A0A0L0UWV5_9BASI|nr:hypothetical protein H4Q26_017686 [Puccinia striiformis f. sp. tritici PST-130]KNE91517.1 hypothetical protein PSTG_15076 [Puccinia striiformis f. sp. tritici PST-78]
MYGPLGSKPVTGFIDCLWPIGCSMASPNPPFSGRVDVDQLCLVADTCMVSLVANQSQDSIDRGDWRGIKFTAKNHTVLMRQLCKSFDGMHSQRHLHQVDFDLMAVFLMQEMGADLDIREIVRMILGHFGNEPHPLTTGNVFTSACPHASPEPLPTASHQQPPVQIAFSPKTPLQAQIHHAALLVKATLRHYDRTPTTSIPFCV